MSEMILTVQRAAELLECSERTIEDKLANHDLPGIKIGKSWQIPAQAFYERINDSYLFEERGEVEVKGKGPMRTWYLIGRRPAARTAAVRPCGSPN